MRYRLYLYKTTPERVSDHVIENINNAVYTESEEIWNINRTTRFLKEFDVENVKSIIERETSNKCRVCIKFPPKDLKQIQYLYVATLYECVHDVLPKVYAIAATYGLVLYDSETKRTFYEDLVDGGFISIKLREREIGEYIYRADKFIWHFKNYHIMTKRVKKGALLL